MQERPRGTRASEADRDARTRLSSPQRTARSSSLEAVLSSPAEGGSPCPGTETSRGHLSPRLPQPQHLPWVGALTLGPEGLSGEAGTAPCPRPAPPEQPQDQPQDQGVSASLTRLLTSGLPLRGHLGGRGRGGEGSMLRWSSDALAKRGALPVPVISGYQQLIDCFCRQSLPSYR